MSIPSIHAEKVADIRFRNERARILHLHFCPFTPLRLCNRQTELSVFHLGELASVVMYGNKTFSHLPNDMAQLKDGL